MFDPKDHIRTVPDWPQEGVQFRDITTLLSDAKVFRQLIDAFVHHYYDQPLDAIVGIDARGFILGAPLAYELKTAFIPVRKKGKLPFETYEESYELEYGEAVLQVHADALKPGQRAVIMDDLIATGGTLAATCKLVERLGADIVECAAIVDLPDLGGSRAIREAGHSVFTLCAFDGD
ncbi:adenine phosphoribosyltransferase [Saccharospirillum sp. MSK14-1]|uniref:adenine phosphoribosyltransferase n=1 Tax=Saccharospirillum sp. MSK14-1 TaxID=1897632 RepID=UPI000D395B40|nr:adenine phosphoribosyltransferase [Saccharospirillum sp. MSK14-1]PTY36142.1 adenine phosphoribosyltransferase [Saccharospirillum sp. MSK14-1]